MQTYSGQFFLLTIDPLSGRQFPVSEQKFHLTLAGALLFDASFQGFINDDWKNLSVLKTAETGYAPLDETLRCLQVFEGAVPLDKALALVAAHGSTLRRLVMDSLVSEGIISRKKQGAIRHSRKSELFIPDLPLVVSLQKELRHVVLQEEIPDPQFPPMISLMVAGGLSKYIFSAGESKDFGEKINWLAGMESLGREIIQSVKKLESADLEKDVAGIIGFRHDQPKTYAGGMDAVLSSLSYLYKETGIGRSRKLISRLNQFEGFECPGCAWPNPDKNRSGFEFCENGAKNVSAEATTRVISSEFFKKWSVPDLMLTPEYWLEQQGRLTEPMLLDEKATHYRPLEWEEAFKIVSEELNSLDHSDEAVFYASGRTSNEAAFLYQLFARALGTNNLPNSANICHEPSGKALTMSLGFGKSSVTLDDFPKADAIFVFGHNPGSNHPRMLSSLQAAVRQGCKIVAVNPMTEASLMGFADPQEAASYFGKQTALSHLYLQPKINGDMALVRGMVKTILEAEEKEGGVIDSAFIQEYTSGFDVYRQLVKETSWEEIVSSCGLEKDRIAEVARVYMNAKSVITTWCLGITHHRNSVETIREIINLQLMKGNIGRPGAGVCPVRGHSNIQGIRSCGQGENMPLTFLESLEKHFHIDIPKTPGMSVVPAIRAMAEGKVKVLVSLGGNLASAVPDTAFAAQALRNCSLTVMISTKLNKSHLVSGKRTLILPALARTDEDIRNGVKQFSSVEDAMAKIGFTQGCLPPASSAMKSDVTIVAEMAMATLGEKQAIDWNYLAGDNQNIRAAMSQVIPAFRNIDKMKPSDHGFYLDNPLRKRVFKTSDSKAQFSDYPLNFITAREGELLLMTIRSHDQFNTSVFGLNDRYRGIINERRVLFMNREDMQERNIVPEQIVDISSTYDNKLRKLEGYFAIPHDITRGCVAAYFPETNVLTSINNTSATCETPAFKSVQVTVK